MLVVLSVLVSSITSLMFQVAVYSSPAHGFTVQPGTLIITKNTTGGDGIFNFNTYGPSNAYSSVPTINGTGSITLLVIPGTYTIAETVPTGWTLTSSSCTNGTPGRTAVTAGQTTTCTFNNTKQLPTHLDCVNLRCLSVPGGDADKCKTDADCVNRAPTEPTIPI